MATLACAECGCHEHAELLDATKPGGRLECVACAGPAWRPVSESSIAKSVCDHLSHLYDEWMSEEVGRRVLRLREVSDALATAERSHPHPVSLCA